MIDNSPDLKMEILKTQKDIERVLSLPFNELTNHDILSLSRNGIGLLLNTHNYILEKRPSMVNQAQAADMAIEFRMTAEYNLMAFLQIQEFIEQYNINK